MDIWEANSISTAVTPHSCDTVTQTVCNGDACGGTYSSSRYAGTCDPDGCDFNSYRMGNKTFYGPGMTVNTNSVFTVVTQVCFFQMLIPPLSSDTHSTLHLLLTTPPVPHYHRNLFWNPQRNQTFLRTEWKGNPQLLLHHHRCDRKLHHHALLHRPKNRFRRHHVICQPRRFSFHVCCFQSWNGSRFIALG